MVSILAIRTFNPLGHFVSTQCVRAYAINSVRAGSKSSSVRAGSKNDTTRASSKKNKAGKSKLQLSARFKQNANKSQKADKFKSQRQFKYGLYGGLKENENKFLETNANLVEKITEFEELKLLPEVRKHVINLIKKDSLNTTEEIHPSPIQTIAIKRLSKNLMEPKLQVHAIAAETGSGKTMAYCAPLLDYLKRQEIETPEKWESIKDKAIIRSVILVPTLELVDQIYTTLTCIPDTLGIHVHKWTTGVVYQQLLENLKSRTDILITTPSKLLSLQRVRMISRADLILKRIEFVVLDEADTLLDKSWLEDTHKALKAMSDVNHLVLCSATIPNEFDRTMTKMFPNAIPLTTPRLHKLPKGINFRIINAAVSPYKGSKIKALAQTLYAIAYDGTDPGFEKRCIVFINEKKNVDNVVQKLRNEYGHDVVGLTGDMEGRTRLELIRPFISPPEKLTEQEKQIDKDLNDQETVNISGSNISIGNIENSNKASNFIPKLRVLVTTDLLARGLNFKGVRNVILYDVPITAIDLVHRAGRTARMRQSGRVFMIIDKKTQSWAKAVPTILKKNKALT